MNSTDPTDADRAGCSLCELPTPSPPVTDADVDGEFCCRGCLEVGRALGDADGAEAAAIEDAVAGEGRSIEAVEGEDAFLAVDGMHCATCEAFLEGRATAVDGVHAAEASYASDAVRLVYDPDRVDPDALPDLLSGFGYVARERGSGGDDGVPDNDVALVKFLIGGGMFGMMAMIWYAIFLYPQYFGYPPVVELGTFDGLYVYLNIWLMASFVLFYTGYPILRGAYVSLRAGMPNMDLLVAVAALAAYAYSTLALAVGRTDLYFDVSIAVVLVVTGGTYYEGVVKRRATGLLSELTERQVAEARRHPDGDSVPIEEVEAGDRLLVRAGERVPLDGTVREGSAAVDESLVTGESLPVGKSPGDFLRGGTVVTDAPLVLEVGEGAESTLDRLVELLWTVQSARPGVQRLADKLATIFVPLVLVVATVVAAAMLATGSTFTAAMLVGLTVLIVSCPCALGLATPLAIASGVRDAAERGIVVVAETIFEDAPAVDVVALDKTGTLTTGSMAVDGVHPGEGVDPSEILRRAAAVERLSEHPIAEAIVAAADGNELSTDGGVDVGGPGSDGVGKRRQANDGLSAGTDAVDVEGFERERRGVTGRVGGERVVVGHPDLLADRGLTVTGALVARIDRIRADGDVPVVVGWGGRARGVIAVGDAPREEWREAVETLAAGRQVVLLTGDEGAAADRFRAVDGIDEVFAGVPPEAKAETVRRLRSRGTVAMVGDGSNDAPALAAADVGIAMGSGTKLATDAADAVVVGDDLGAVAETLEIAGGTNRRIRQNLGWAFVYNGIAIPLAITGLLNPFLAAVAMATSSTLVVLNSSRSLDPADGGLLARLRG